MKTLIVYSSKYGFTEEVVNQIKSSITHECNALDIKKIHAVMPELIDSSDNIILASSIYVGNIDRKMKEFIVANEKHLLQKNIGIVVSGMQTEEIQNEIESNFSKELLEKSSFVEWIGGEFNFEKMGWMDKMIVKKVASVKQTTTVYFEEKMKLIVEAIESWS